MADDTTPTGMAELLARVAADDDLRARLLADPTAVLRGELGVSIPDDVSVVVLEDTVDTVHLVLPRRVGEVAAEVALTGDELEAVAGADGATGMMMGTGGGGFNFGEGSWGAGAAGFYAFQGGFQGGTPEPPPTGA